MSNLQVTLPDGSVQQVPPGTSPLDIARNISPRLADAAIVAKVDDALFDLKRPLEGDAKVQILTTKDADALYVYRHSTAHLCAAAVLELFPETKLGIGPPIDNGFYYDFDRPQHFTPEDLEKIEAKMWELQAKNLTFDRQLIPKPEGLAKYREMNEPMKVELIEERAGDVFSEYTLGPHFIDFCRGPHVPDTSKIKAFKLLSIAGAYWKGDEKNKQLQRIYGTAWFTKKEQDEYLTRLEEAKKRDHRILGRQLGLFHIDEKVGQGLVLWKPKGAVIRQELQNFIGEHLRRQGYHQVFTPHIGKLELYKTSGHFPYYADSQFPPLVDREEIAHLAIEGKSCGELANRLEKGDIEGFLLKPMNCPHHIRIYASDQHSYRDLPIRLSEFGTVYRYEQSGELGGMTRVRGFTQDDAHLFCTEDQIPQEVAGCLELVKIIFGVLGMHDYRVRVGLRDPNSEKYVGEPEHWDRAEKACLDAAATLGVPFSPEPGEAAFYGPKIDFVVKDVIGREWQLGTVQVDYQLPRRFDLSYIGPDNKPHRPVMIHRAPFGSMERFVGVLIEHFAGAFPTWLSPVQATVLPITDKQLPYANEVAEKLKAAGVRVTVDDRSDKINLKIRDAQLQKIPYMLVVGGREAESGQVSVRHRKRADLGAASVEEFLKTITAEIATRSGDQ
ncbi:MAG TPA: threonine--tRNA ligase [Bryobacteraceae bacterium]|jgi:threonyl-tRNA synthetase|nr:threonine--tRNA ligase [Bryobacteraceae bacterium]